MHDTIDLETRGLPAIFIATTEFTEAADAQAKALGANPIGVFVAHPIQDRTDEELQALADGVLEQIVAGLTT
ncbi:MAG: hypothetical protein JRH01_06805 [Deltaproteobacteria bacterium]|nr:hypothetical protein [Deltaproteobacteria bacterium]MBW2393499.1 hypothetical protein [Deltaproteobacteria bacterium]